MDVTGIGGSMPQKGLDGVGAVPRESVDSSPAVPGGDDVARFDASMDSPAEAGESGAVQTPADRLVEGVGNLSEHINAGRAEVADVMGKENVTQSDLLKASFKMMETNAVVSAVSKTSEKITSAIKTLQQG